MYSNFKIQLDKDFQAEVIDDELIISATGTEVSNESLNKLEEFVDTLGFSQATRQAVFDDTLSLVEDISLVQAIKDRIE